MKRWVQYKLIERYEDYSEECLDILVRIDYNDKQDRLDKERNLVENMEEGL